MAHHVTLLSPILIPGPSPQSSVGWPLGVVPAEPGGRVFEPPHWSLGVDWPPHPRSTHTGLKRLLGRSEPAAANIFCQNQDEGEKSELLAPGAKFKREPNHSHRDK